MRNHGIRFILRALTPGLLMLPLLMFAETPTENEIARLRAEIARHDELYFKKASPEITDAEYDRLKRTLAGLERQARPGEKSGPGIGDDRTGNLPHRKHLTPMLSLAKSHTKEQLREFFDRIAARFPGESPAFAIEPKYDGLAVSVTYENGVLTRAVTRGDGAAGDDVTDALLSLAAIPRALTPDTTVAGGKSVPELVELRGEVYMPLSEFRRINRERTEAGEEPHANPRNLAVGTLKGGAGAGAGRRLAVVFHGIGAWKPDTEKPASQHGLRQRLTGLGLPHVVTPRMASDFEGAWAVIGEIGRSRDKLPYPIDGAVVKLDPVSLREKMGESADAPRWAIAHKFAPETAETRLRAITFGIGRTGALTPVAEFDPVRLGGATVRRATLHNREEIVRRDLRVGDLITVEKAGDIIPVVTGADRSARDATSVVFSFPTQCPSCATTLAQRPGETAVFCPEESCPARVRRSLEHFVSKGAVGIAGFGPALIEKLVVAKLVRTPADLYRLRREDLAALPGVGEKSTDRLLAEINRSKSAESWRFVHGLGIPDVGASTARKIAGRFKSLSEFAGARREELAALDLGKTTERSLDDYLAEPGKKALLAELIRQGCGAGK